MNTNRLFRILALLTVMTFSGTVAAWMTTTQSALSPLILRRKRATTTTTTTCLYSNSLDQDEKYTVSRRQFSFTTAAVVTAVSLFALPVSPAAAAAKGPPPMSVTQAAAAVRNELQGPTGSVARLQAALDAGDFATLLETTKTMDQSLRKGIVGQAKYYWADGTPGTQLSNNVTFDLIGMNRNARQGQENAAGVQEYLDALKQDLQQILEFTQQAAAAAASS